MRAARAALTASCSAARSSLPIASAMLFTLLYSSTEAQRKHAWSHSTAFSLMELFITLVSSLS